jgi:hypothetical protein
MKTATTAAGFDTCTTGSPDDMSPEEREQLRDYNRRVVRWAGQFDRKFHDTVLVLGWAGDKDGMTARRRSVASLTALSREHHRAGRIDKPLTARTTWRHLAALKAAGCVAVSTAKRGFADKHRGMNFANSYLPDFTVVIREGRPAEWGGFWEPLEAEVTAPGTSHSPQHGTEQPVIGTKGGAKVGTVSSSGLAPVSDQDHEPGQGDKPPLLAKRDKLPGEHPASDSTDNEKVAAACPAQWPADSALRGYVRTAWNLYRKDGYRISDVVIAVDNGTAWTELGNPEGFLRSARFRATLDGIRRHRLRAMVSEQTSYLRTVSRGMEPAAARELAIDSRRRVIAAYGKAGEPVPEDVRYALGYWLADLAPQP